jgi:hypothetical protein
MICLTVALACKPFLENDPRNISSTIFSILTLKVLRRRTVWDVQRGKKCMQTTPCRLATLETAIRSF